MSQIGTLEEPDKTLTTVVKIIEDIEKEENEEEDDLDIGQPTNQPISEVGTEIALPEIVDVKIPERISLKKRSHPQKVLLRASSRSSRTS